MSDRRHSGIGGVSPPAWSDRSAVGSVPRADTTGRQNSGIAAPKFSYTSSMSPGGTPSFSCTSESRGGTDRSFAIRCSESPGGTTRKQFTVNGELRADISIPPRRNV